MKFESGIEKIAALLLLIIMLLVSFPYFAFSDAESNDWIAEEGERKTTTGSDASFDKRLPPVLPGEEVSDGNRKMKVWSTAGPVPVAPQPEPWNQKNERKIEPGSVGVIIDRRKDDSK